MANISSAYGTISFRAGKEQDGHIVYDKELTEKLIKVFNHELGEGSKAVYGTGIGKETWKHEEGSDGVWDTATFYGTGRWAYEANIRYTYDWLKDTALKEEWAELNNCDWEILWDFNDEEAGCEVLYEMVAGIKHKAGEDKAEETIYSEDDYDYTPENLVKCGVYENLEDAYESMGLEYE